MQQKLTDHFVEDKNQLAALEQFAPVVREILRGYKAKRKLSAIARQLEIHPARLTEMITKDNNGKYKRRITPYCLAKFIDYGLMNVEQILNGRRL